MLMLMPALLLASATFEEPVKCKHKRSMKKAPYKHSTEKTSSTAIKD